MPTPARSWVQFNSGGVGTARGLGEFVEKVKEKAQGLATAKVATSTVGTHIENRRS